MRDFLGEQGERAMVAPLSVNVHVLLAQSLVAQAQLLDHAQARRVLRADVDLDSVQAEGEEAVVDSHCHGDRSDSAPGHARVDPVPDLPGQDRTPAQSRHGDLTAEVPVDLDGERQGLSALGLLVLHPHHRAEPRQLLAGRGQSRVPRS